MANLTLQCGCGTVTGVVHDVSPAKGNYIACYCNDCRAFARYLGHADETLDEFGGTRIFQTVSAWVHFNDGRDRLACLKLSPKGILRWYAGCCRTPIGNTLGSPTLPFVGLVHTCLKDGPDGVTCDAAMGPLLGAVFTRSARGDSSAQKPTEMKILPLMTRFARFMLMARLRGDHKRSPFFGPDGKPMAVPHVLSEEERASAYGGLHQ